MTSAATIQGMITTMIATFCTVSVVGHAIDLGHLDTVNRIYSRCREPLLRECPEVDTDVKKRLLCMFGQTSCPDEGTTYYCGVDNKTGMLVEDCFRSHRCPIGTKNVPILYLDSKTPTASLSCADCERSRIQSVPHESSTGFIAECYTKRSNPDFENMKDKMILVADRWPRNFDLYACDYKRGYSNMYQTSLCDPSSFCECVQSVECTDPNKPQVMPNGTCDAVCPVDRDPYDDFRCPSPRVTIVTPAPKNNGTKDITFQNTLDHSVTTAKTQTADAPINQDNDDATGLSIGLVVLIVVLVVVLFAIIGVAVYFLRPCIKKICKAGGEQGQRVMTSCGDTTCIDTEEISGDDDSNVNGFEFVCDNESSRPSHQLENAPKQVIDSGDTIVMKGGPNIKAETCIINCYQLPTGNIVEDEQVETDGLDNDRQSDRQDGPSTGPSGVPDKEPDESDPLISGQEQRMNTLKFKPGPVEHDDSVTGVGTMDDRAMGPEVNTMGGGASETGSKTLYDGANETRVKYLYDGANETKVKTIDDGASETGVKDRDGRVRGKETYTMDGKSKK